MYVGLSWDAIAALWLLLWDEVIDEGPAPDRGGVTGDIASLVVVVLDVFENARWPAEVDMTAAANAMVGGDVMIVYEYNRAYNVVLLLL